MTENEKLQSDGLVEKQDAAVPNELPPQVNDQTASAPAESEEKDPATQEEEGLNNWQANAGLMKTIEEKDAAIQELTKQYQRLQADFENFRRRTRQEKEELSVVVAEGIVLEILPVVDNFERALTAAADDAKAVRSGVELIFRQMKSSLEKLGVSTIEAVGKSFDPNEHQAVMRIEDAEAEDGTIVEELQKGYKVKNRVVRPSMVKVVNNG